MEFYDGSSSSSQAENTILPLPQIQICFENSNSFILRRSKFMEIIFLNSHFVSAKEKSFQDAIFKSIIVTSAEIPKQTISTSLIICS